VAYQVALLNFEGPLDLLLQLVERSDLPASELSLAELTEQYLSYSSALTTLDAAQAAGFTALASKLLYLKSSALLPEPDELAEEVIELQQQLAAYGRYREAAGLLAAALADDGRSWNRQAATRPQQPAQSPNLTPPALRQALTEALARASASARHSVPVPAISLADMTPRLAQAGGGTPSLQSFFEQLESRIEVIVAFLAALELWRTERLRLVQDGQFKVIRVAYA
jgi:segregation and condensation protein A